MRAHRCCGSRADFKLLLSNSDKEGSTMRDATGVSFGKAKLNRSFNRCTRSSFAQDVSTSFHGFHAHYHLNVISQQVSYYRKSRFSQSYPVRSFMWSSRYNVIFQTAPEGSHAGQSAYCYMIMGELTQRHWTVEWLMFRWDMQDGWMLPSADPQCFFSSSFFLEAGWGLVYFATT